MSWVVYVLYSHKDENKYIGSTNCLSRRLNDHNRGYVKSTKNRRPLILLYSEKCESETDARNREKFFKTHKGYNYLKRVMQNRDVV